MTKYTLIHSVGCGSVIAQLMLELGGLPYELETIPYLEDGPQRERLLKLNPLGQVPTLILPDGQVMTESAAITLHVADRAPEAGLTPAPDAPERPAFLRWLVFIVAAVYPTFTYGDEPSRWTFEGAAAEELRRRSNEHRQSLWRYLEGQVAGPWFLGPKMSALDLYLAPMTRWRPRTQWFAENCPKIHAIAGAVDAHPKLGKSIASNFA
jgi:GST-like protein